MPQIFPLGANTNCNLLDRTTKTWWTRQTGDWLDARGVLNGPQATVTGTGSPATVSIAGLGDVLIQGINSVSKIVIDGTDVTSQCIWTASSSNAALTLPSSAGNPVMVPYGGNSMTVTSNATGSWRVDSIYCPAVADPLPVDTSVYRAPDLFRIDPTSYVAMRNPTGFAGSVTPGPNGNIFTGNTVYSNDQGVAYVQCKCFNGGFYPTTGNGRVARCDYGVGPQPVLYTAWLMKIGSDVWANCADLGVKLSGPTGDESRFSICEHSCAAAIGGLPNPRNPQIFSLWDYYADQTPGAGPGGGLSNDHRFISFMSERWVWIERASMMNSGALDSNGNLVQDGWARTWVNGIQVQDRPEAWFANSTSRFNTFSLQIYQGGTQSFRGLVTYYIGPYMASTQRIGVPPDIAPLLGSSVVILPETSPNPTDDIYTGAHGTTIAGGRTVSGGGTGGAVPLWRQNLAINQWTEIQGSSMAAHPPTVSPGGVSGPSSILNTWTGVSIDSRVSKVWSLASGGHTDYYGNQVMSLDLSADAPVWVQVLAADASGTFTLPNNAGRYSNGHPASCHTYYTQQYIEQRNRAMRFGATAFSDSGNSGPQVEGFDGTAWDAGGTWVNIPTDATADQATCKDPNTGDVYVFITNVSVYKWTQAANSWAQNNVGFPPITVQATPTAWDTKRSRIGMFRGTGQHHTYDPATGKFTAQTLTGDATAIAAIQASTNGVGMVYEPSLDAYLMRRRATGGDVYVIDAGTFVASVLPTTGGTNVPTTANISGTIDNVYTKWLYAPALGGVVYIPSYAANAWFLRTH